MDIKGTLNSMTGGKLPMFQEDPACVQFCPNLTFKQRVMGFGACLGVGTLMSFMGTMTLVGGPSAKNVRIFIIMYIFGNVIALCATGFLLGPKSQCRQMFHPTRRYSTIFYLVMMIIVFSVAVAKQHILLVLFLLFIEIIAATWYGISYIPFARKMVISFMRRSPICKPCFQVYDDVKGQHGNTGTGGVMSMKGFTALQEEG